MRNNSNSNSLFNVSKGTTGKELWNKEFSIIKDISCLYLSFMWSTRQSSSSITINAIAKTLSDIGISHGYFIRSTRSLHQPLVLHQIF